MMNGIYVNNQFCKPGILIETLPGSDPGLIRYYSEYFWKIAILVGQVHLKDENPINFL